MNFDYGVPEDLIIDNLSKRAYIKGSFMGCGSISNPEKSYHAEFVSNKEEQSVDLCKLLQLFNINAKRIYRKTIM